ncbi:MAG: NADH-quinone oxidoreductase subunit K [Candidatus Omnitrophica bacterium]|nr:NADH-quinone oxidoreductase subunit K [Candidatus Omnitrophota bacterium]
MSFDVLHIFWPFGVFIAMLFIIGLYCVLATLNLVRALIGLELLIKAVTLLLVVVGFAGGHLALTQALVITLIVIEVVVMTVSMGIVLGIHRHNNSLDVRGLKNIKG